MVYIIQCLTNGMSSKKEALEAYRQEFANQIRQGVLLLPVAFKLVEVVKTDSIIDVEIVKDQTKVAEKVYLEDEPIPKDYGFCVNCKHCHEETPLGRRISTCIWCDAMERSVAYGGGCSEYFELNEEE